MGHEWRTMTLIVWLCRGPDRRAHRASKQESSETNQEYSATKQGTFAIKQEACREVYNRPRLRIRGLRRGYHLEGSNMCCGPDRRAMWVPERWWVLVR